MLVVGHHAAGARQPLLGDRRDQAALSIEDPSLGQGATTARRRRRLVVEEPVVRAERPRELVACDGQVSVGQTVMKGTARKVRRLSPGGRDVVVGFAGSTADAFTLLERLEKKLEAAPGQLQRACVELAKDWRTDKYLRNLEAMLIVTDGAQLYVVTGAGDVLEPEHDVAAIGSGGNFALAAARGLMETDLDGETVARRAMAIAAEICVYTNGNLTVEVLG